MIEPDIDFDLKINPELPKRMDFRIGCIGAGFIMKNIQLSAYRNVGFNPIAITDLIAENAKEAAKKWNIPKVYSSYVKLIEDKEIEILDIAIPPDQQINVIRKASEENDHIRGILAQKPLAMNYKEAKEIVEICKKANIKLSINSNMRYDQSMRALKTILDRGYIGEPVLATIEMRAIPHWQEFLRKYDRLTILNMSVHHIDIFRYLFGDPYKIIASARPDPRTKFNHIDGITVYIFEYKNNFRAISIDDVWAGPGKGNEPERDIYIKWRVEGLEGIAKGTIGWPYYPIPTPSTIDFTIKQIPGYWFSPRWDKAWFPDAFVGTMSQLLRAVESGGKPEIDAEDNLKTLAAVEACYMSIEKSCAVSLDEIE